MTALFVILLVVYLGTALVSRLISGRDFDWSKIVFHFSFGLTFGLLSPLVFHWCSQ